MADDQSPAAERCEIQQPVFGRAARAQSWLRRVHDQYLGRVERGEIAPEDPTARPTFPNPIAYPWHNAGTTIGLGFPRQSKRRCMGNPPLETGTDLDFAQRFSWWPEPMRAAVTGETQKRNALLVLNGDAGTGRTFLATWLALSDCVWSGHDTRKDPPRPKRDYAQLYARAWDLLDKLKRFGRAGQDGESIARLARSVDFLVIDDLEDAGTTWEINTLASIVLHRASNERRTVLATYSDAGSFQATWGAAVLRAMRRGTIVNTHRNKAPELARTSVEEYI